MNADTFTSEELAKAYQISVQQAERYIQRFGADRKELHRLLGSSDRTERHRSAEIDRTPNDVSYG